LFREALGARPLVIVFRKTDRHRYDDTDVGVRSMTDKNEEPANLKTFPQK
jgi:hypothetical protein